MDPSKLLEYLGYEYNSPKAKIANELLLIYRTIDDYGRIDISKFGFQWDNEDKTLHRYFWPEDVLLPIDQAENLDRAVSMARAYLEKVFTDSGFGTLEDKKFLRLWEEKCKKGKGGKA